MNPTGASPWKMPSFSIKPEQIRFLRSPMEFFETIKTGLSAARSRVVISSLYLGAKTEKEKELLDTITSSLERQKYIDNFRSNLLLDAARAMRKSDNTFPKLQNLERHFPQFRCTLYADPATKTSFIRRLLPSKLREVLGVMHMKFFVFDDTVLITGANLGDSYFTNRMDRYLLIEDCSDLANYFESVFYVASALNDPHIAPLDFKNASQITSKPLQNAGYSTTTISTDTSRLIGMCPNDTPMIPVSPFSPWSCVLMSAYLNITDDLTRQLKEILEDSRLEVVTSSVKSHGFYKAKGLASIIPDLYEAVKDRFLKRTIFRPPLQTEKSGIEYILEYNRPGWSFHGKGITFFYDDRVIMQFGSSNLGFRSSHRDVENIVSINSVDSNFREKLKDEIERIRNDCEMVGVNDVELAPWHIRFLASLFRRFM